MDAIAAIEVSQCNRADLFVVPGFRTGVVEPVVFEQVSNLSALHLFALHLARFLQLGYASVKTLEIA